MILSKFYPFWRLTMKLNATVTAINEAGKIKLYVPAKLIRALQIEPGQLISIGIENTGVKNVISTGNNFKRGLGWATKRQANIEKAKYEPSVPQEPVTVKEPPKTVSPIIDMDGPDEEEADFLRKYNQVPNAIDFNEGVRSFGLERVKVLINRYGVRRT